MPNTRRRRLVNFKLELRCCLHVRLTVAIPPLARCGRVRSINPMLICWTVACWCSFGVF